MTKITPEKFERYVGRPPILDDLERCNCKEAGKHGHYFCGWDESRNMPNFINKPVITKKSPKVTGRRRYRVLHRIFRPDVMVLQLEVEGPLTPATTARWWIDAKPEHLLLEKDNEK